MNEQESTKLAKPNNTKELYAILVPVVNAFTEKEKASKFEQLTRWLYKTLEQFPPDDMRSIRNYWSTQQVPREDMTLAQAPTVEFHAWFRSNCLADGRDALCAVNREGTTFHFDIKLLFAPREVVMTVMAHEMVHVLLYVKGLKFERQPSQLATERVKEGYREDFRPEEQAVDEALKQWGFDEELVSIWDATISTYGLKWEKPYKKLLRERRIQQRRAGNPA